MRAMGGILTFQVATVKKKQTGYCTIGLQFKTLRQEDYKFKACLRNKVRSRPA